VRHATESVARAVQTLLEDAVLRQHQAFVPASAVGAVLEKDFLLSALSSALYILSPVLQEVDISRMQQRHEDEEFAAVPNMRSPRYWYRHDDTWGAQPSPASCVSSLWVSAARRLAFYDMSAGVATRCAA
jgi:hypothetical protein